MDYKNSVTFRVATALPVLLCAALLLKPLPAGSRIPDFKLVEAAGGVYLHTGKHEEMSVGNLGDIANIGFIVGKKSVAVIDPGGSPTVGEALREAIATVTHLPVSHLILTHMHPDHVFGSSAFADVDQVVAHHNYARAALMRAEFYRDTYAGLFARGDTPVTLTPTQHVTDDLVIELGDRSLLLQAHETAHTDNDLTVFDKTTGTLWASDLVFNQRIPSLDGSLPGWIRVLEKLERLPVTMVIPGHGLPGSWESLASPQLRYLKALLLETRQFIARNRKLSEAVNEIGLAEKSFWLLFDSQHRGNVTKAYTELEWE